MQRSYTLKRCLIFYNIFENILNMNLRMFSSGIFVFYIISVSILYISYYLVTKSLNLKCKIAKILSRVKYILLTEWIISEI